MPEVEGLEWRPQYTLFSFWAAWCAPCVDELPELNELAKDQNQFRVVLINIDTEDSDSLQLAQTLLTDLGHPAFEHIYGKGALLEKFDGQSLPAHYLVNPDRKVIWRFEGVWPWHLESTRNDLLELIAVERKKVQGQVEN
jgi:thiol-disulfide isomerase/thioredoxin